MISSFAARARKNAEEPADRISFEAIAPGRKAFSILFKGPGPTGPGGNGYKFLDVPADNSVHYRTGDVGGAAEGYNYGSSHKCMHDLAPGRSASAVGRRCGCARARYAAVQSSVAQLTAACAGPALGGGPARRQPDQTQAADSMALTWRRTVKDSGTRPRLSQMFCAGAERSLTVQPPWNGQSVTIPVSGVAGLSGSPQLLSRYRRCSLVT